MPRECEASNLFADRTGPQGGSHTINFQRIIFLVAFFVAVVLKFAIALQKHTDPNGTVQR